jgi:hypothetical protein
MVERITLCPIASVSLVRRTVEMTDGETQDLSCPKLICHFNNTGAHLPSPHCPRIEIRNLHGLSLEVSGYAAETDQPVSV